MTDTVILKALETRKRWRTLRSVVPEQALVPDAKNMLMWYDAYYKAYPDKEALEHPLLLSYIKTKANLSPEQFIPLKAAVERLAGYKDDAAVAGIVNSLLERDFGGRLGALLTQYEAGREVDIVAEVAALNKEVRQQQDNSNVLDFIDTSAVASILEEEGTDYGLKFPTALLQRAIKGILGGTLVGFAAGVDSGKSSFLCSMLTHFARQLEKYFDADRPMLFLSNEGAARRLVPRVYQAALGKTTAELLEMSRAGTLLPAYEKVVGRRDRIRLKDIHGMNLAQLETLIEESRACVVVVDMPSGLRVNSRAGANRTEGVEQTWQTLRELAVMYNCVIVGTIQLSNEGYDQLFPPMSALKDSKVGLQGALDVLISMGRLNDPQLGGLRGFATPKNKMPISGQQSHVQGEVIFDPVTCQWDDGA